MAGIELFSPAELQHFDEVGLLLRPEPVSSWTDPGVADLLAQVEVIVGHWVCPLLDEAMLAATPGLGLGSQGTELRRMAETAAEEVRRYAAGAPQLNQITRDRPDVVA